ncbi:MAG: thioesterase [Anaerolineae bacterium]|nr:thioesterase [Anaerolineae bacterium]
MYPNTLWVRKINPDVLPRVRLFCFPYSGASAAIYHPWAQAMPAGIEVCPVELPGHGSRLAEPLYEQLSPLVEAALEALLPYLDVPFALFGHSLGALVSFELARSLQRQHGLAPACLFVSGHAAPQIPDPEPPIHTLPEEAFVEKLRALNGTPDEVLDHPELRALVLPILRADFTMCETYHYGDEPRLRCPIAAFAGLSDPYVTRDDLSAWREQTVSSFSMHLLPGDHFYLQREQRRLIEIMARKLNEWLGLG